MKCPKTILFCGLLLFLSLLVYSTKAQDNNVKSDSIQINRKYFYKSVVLGATYYVGSMFILKKTWYNDRKVIPFHFYNDNKAYLQVDKFGHAFGAYIQSYVGYQILTNAGITKTNALIYGGTCGIFLQTPIEIMDGIHEGWGFSWGD